MERPNRPPTRPTASDEVTAARGGNVILTFFPRWVEHDERNRTEWMVVRVGPGPADGVRVFRRR
ncbi:hypothetical protein GCM10009759_66000 [Kitasatospora saccharophila]|uniref:Uncharacterized protein n=1 Tax=Kitasatospora saccharophila TaxID=407973 RepID=A0ABP5JIP2_9ACTN